MREGGEERERVSIAHVYMQRSVLEHLHRFVVQNFLLQLLNGGGVERSHSKQSLCRVRQLVPQHVRVYECTCMQP